MAQRLAKALGIVGGRDPRFHIVEDLFLDTLVETAQIAAFERTWYRANAEIRRARKQAEDAAGQSFENYQRIGFVPASRECRSAQCPCRPHFAPGLAAN